MRKLKHILKQLSGGPGWQVVVTTHSPFLIDVADDPRSLVLFKRPSLREPPSIIQLECDPFAGGDGREQEREMLRATIDFHPTVCEAFFAHETILVEGDSELAVLKFHPRLYELCGVDIEQVQTRSVIACGGKWTIPAFARLLKAFGVPFRVVHDLDRRGRGEAALADSPPFDPYRANRHIVGIVGEDKVFICEDTLEDILWRGDGRVPSKDKPYLAWKRVRELCDNPTLLEEHARLKELVRFVFGHLETATMRP
jgi:predicted ATP-dependent endonuclease of OLD family